MAHSETEDIEEFEAQKLQAEERQSGNLKWSVVTAYFRSGGSGLFIALTFFVMLLGPMAGGAVDFWVSYWLVKTSKITRISQSAPSHINLI